MRLVQTAIQMVYLTNVQIHNYPHNCMITNPLYNTIDYYSLSTSQATSVVSTDATKPSD